MGENTTSADVVTHATRLDHFEHIFLVTGPAGCGKSTVAQYLAEQMKVPYVEGDDVSDVTSTVAKLTEQFHSAENKAKMAADIPLTDADRWDWLITLRDEAVKHLRASNACIVTCSALKQKYRDVIRTANYHFPTVQIHFIFLKLDEQVLLQRVAARKGHYMKAEMVHSQMEALEEPDVNIETDVIKVDVRTTKEEVQQKALAEVKAKIGEYEALSRQKQEEEAGKDAS